MHIPCHIELHLGFFYALLLFFVSITCSLLTFSTFHDCYTVYYKLWNFSYGQSLVTKLVVVLGYNFT